MMVKMAKHAKPCEASKLLYLDPTLFLNQLAAAGQILDNKACSNLRLQTKFYVSQILSDIVRYALASYFHVRKAQSDICQILFRLTCMSEAPQINLSDVSQT